MRFRDLYAHIAKRCIGSVLGDWKNAVIGLFEGYI